MLVALVVTVVSGALVVGAVWGAFGAVPSLVEGLLLSTASGALITSIAFELVEPAVDKGGLGLALGALGVGTAVFTGADDLIDEVWSNETGLGIIAATEVVPEAFADARHGAGLAITAGFIVTFLLAS